MYKLFKIFKLIIVLTSCLFSCVCFGLINAKEFTTKSGIKATLVTDKSTDLISVSIAFKDAGAKSDPINKQGLSFTTMQMLHRGKINGLNRYQRARKLIDLGVLYGMHLNISQDNLFINFKAPKENFAKTLNEVNNLLMFRDFDINDLNNLKVYIPQNSDINKTEETIFAHKVLLSLVFPDHPYGSSINGTYDDKQTLTKSDLINYLNTKIAKDNFLISVVGDIKQKQLEKLLEKTFSKLPLHAKIQKIPKPNIVLNSNITPIYKDSPQSGASFIQEGLPIKHPDYYALVALLDILASKEFTSRLWKEIREKRGIVYDIGADLRTELKDKAIIIGWFKSDNDKVKLIIDIIKEEWRKMKENGVTKQEFNDAKTGLIGSYALNFTTPESISSYLLFLKVYGINVDFIKTRNEKIKKLTLKDINNATKYLTPEKLTFVVVGKPNINRENAKKNIEQKSPKSKNNKLIKKDDINKTTTPNKTNIIKSQKKINNNKNLKDNQNLFIKKKTLNNYKKITKNNQGITKNNQKITKNNQGTTKND